MDAEASIRLHLAFYPLHETVIGTVTVDGMHSPSVWKLELLRWGHRIANPRTCLASSALARLEKNAMIFRADGVLPCDQQSRCGVGS